MRELLPFLLPSAAHIDCERPKLDVLDQTECPLQVRDPAGSLHSTCRGAPVRLRAGRLPSFRTERNARCASSRTAEQQNSRTLSHFRASSFLCNKLQVALGAFEGLLVSNVVLSHFVVRRNGGSAGTHDVTA
jgi:hypothetical protein